MIRDQYIVPNVVQIFRADALVMVEARTEHAGVIVDSKAFAQGRSIPELGDSVKLPKVEGTWRRASFVPSGKGKSLTDPSDLIVAGHAGRRITSERGAGTVTHWASDGIKAMMDGGGEERSLPAYLQTDPEARGWELLTRTAYCKHCQRPISIYTPSLICGACIEED